MRTLIMIVVVFFIGFILGTGAGFRIFEGMSSELMLEAFDNSMEQFSASSIGNSVQEKIDSEKEKLENNIKTSILDYVKAELGMGDDEEETK